MPAARHYRHEQRLLKVWNKAALYVNDGGGNTELLCYCHSSATYRHLFRVHLVRSFVVPLLSVAPLLPLALPEWVDLASRSENELTLVLSAHVNGPSSLLSFFCFKTTFTFLAQKWTREVRSSPWLSWSRCFHFGASLPFPVEHCQPTALLIQWSLWRQFLPLPPFQGILLPLPPRHPTFWPKTGGSC